MKNPSVVITDGFFRQNSVSVLGIFGVNNGAPEKGCKLQNKKQVVADHLPESQSYRIDQHNADDHGNQA